MKIGIFTPYPETLGGGERYVMTVAECLSQSGNLVNVFWDNLDVKKKLTHRFDLNLDRVNFVKNVFQSGVGFFKKWQAMRDYDVIFFVSDGSVPFLFAKKNILHFQVPFTNLNGRNWLNRVKFSRIHRVICNSKFTQKFVDKEYGIKSAVIYPPVDAENLKPEKKENVILSVGRLGEPLHNKKQEILVEVFGNLCREGLKDWKLILAGGVKKGNEKYLIQLKNRANGLPVKFFVNLDFCDLKKIFGQAKIFWHAAGYDEDEEKHPEKMEHFGIVVVEAMAAGCVPVVIKKGGIPEIVCHLKNGLLWETKAELAEMTNQLIKSPSLWQRLSTQAISDSQKFSKKVFCQKINELLKN